jgi:S1-C subfamily serine protease
MSTRRPLATLGLCLALIVPTACAKPDERAATTDSATTTAAPVVKKAATRADILGFDPAAIFDRTSDGVVTVRAIHAPNGNLDSPEAGAAEGSGFVLSEQGEIVTNTHVVSFEPAGGGPRRVANEVYIEFPDRNVLEAEVVGTDPFYDVALLKVDPDETDLSPLELGDDSQLEVGAPVAAIGSPFGEQRSLSIGVVSATDRSIQSLTDFRIEGAIQTDAAINPGNSGGPLLDAEGRVIGINQQIQTQTGINEGVGFAVPISAVIRSVEQLREQGRAAYAYIGVSSQSLYPQLAKKLGLDTEFGGLIADVVKGSPADRAGLRGGSKDLRFQFGRYTVGGDVILAVDGKDVVLPDDLARHVAEKKPGDVVELEILRDGKRQNVELTLGERPTDRTNG